MTTLFAIFNTDDSGSPIREPIYFIKSADKMQALTKYKNLAGRLDGFITARVITKEEIKRRISEYNSLIEAWSKGLRL